MVKHFLCMGALIAFIVACTFLPLLPGPYDGLAVTLSGMACLFGGAGLLLLAPIGALWLIYEARKRALHTRTPSHPDKGYYFALASVIAASLVAALVSLGALVNTGLTLCAGTLALWANTVSRILPQVKALKHADEGHFNPTPLYHIVVPTAVILLQIVLAGPAIEFSRNYTIRQSAAMITDIERCHDAHGHYPQSLASVWNDYRPAVIGVKEFRYEPHGGAHNLYFEHVSFRLGTREFVMYNKLGEHIMISHDCDILHWTPEELAARRGYYAVHDASIPHWKYFWFD